MGMLSVSALLFCIIMSAIEFFLCLYDKWAAKHGYWRISERHLLLICALGGGVGLFLGMAAFRHKTRHLRFRLMAPICAVAQITLVVLALWKANYLPI